MDQNYELDNSYLLVKLKETVYGVPCPNVQSIVQLSRIFTSPDLAMPVRGYIDIRGKMIITIDLRLFLGIKSVEEETLNVVELIQKRKADHINWLNNLTTSVHENIEFKLATDPHKCAFGVWYDSYKPIDHVMKEYLQRFDAPHKAIHSIAEKVKEFTRNNCHEAALQLIENTRNSELNKMIRLFDSFEEMYRSSIKELVVILKKDKQAIGIIVDEVLSIEKVIEQSGLTMDNALFSNNTFKVGKCSKDETMVIICDTEKLFNI